jgi:hypothetical protein
LLIEQYLPSLLARNTGGHQLKNAAAREIEVAAIDETRTGGRCIHRRAEDERGDSDHERKSLRRTPHRGELHQLATSTISPYHLSDR